MFDGFTVEKDHIGTGAEGQTWCDLLDVEPPSQRVGPVPTITKATPGARRWHARDDDGELYYSGWLVGDQTWLVVCDWASGYAGAPHVFDGRWRQVVG